MIIYFTGTGNSRYIARRIAGETGDSLVSANEKIKKKDTSPIQAGDRLVIVTPTYAWQIPRVVRDWIRQTEFSGKPKVWFVMDCGDSIGKAGKYNQELCREKGFDYMGTAQVVMPENYIAMFTAPGSEEAEEIIRKANPTISRITEQIREKIRFPELKHHLQDGFLSGPVNKAFYPLFVKADGFCVGEACVGCQKCASLCPLNNIRMQNGKPVWGKECTQCMACICGCPEEAIEYGKRSRGKVRYWCK